MQPLLQDQQSQQLLRVSRVSNTLKRASTPDAVKPIMKLNPFVAASSDSLPLLIIQPASLILRPLNKLRLGLSLNHYHQTTLIKCYHKVNLPIQNFKETDNGIFGFQNKSTTAVANIIPEYYYHYYEGFHQELLKTTKSLYYSLLLPDITAPKWNFICD